MTRSNDRPSLTQTTRRAFLAGAAVAFSRLPLISDTSAPRIAVTMDDPNSYDTPLLSPGERNTAILKALGGVRIVLFVTGMRVEGDAGARLLAAWEDSGHLLGNHSWSHSNFNSKDISLEAFQQDILRCEGLAGGRKGFRKLFRYPMLKEGDTEAKRDGLRTFLRKRGYRVGHVTVDASDWYIDQRMRERLGREPNADLTPYRNFYLEHLWDRAQYYDGLSHELLGHSVSHTLLIHHNLLNALFLGDVLRMFADRGWKWIPATQAFDDQVYAKAPRTLPAGESLLWALAKESKKYEGKLRYPGEDDVYEKPAMDKLGL